MSTRDHARRSPAGRRSLAKAWRRPGRAHTGSLALLLGAAVLLAACKGENRPRVEVIGGGDSASVSVSASGPPPASAPTATAYTPASNVEPALGVSLDLRDLRLLMAPATEGRPVDWAAARTLYEQGKNQQTSSGVRPLASLADDTVQALFPNGASVYGRPNFIDALIRDGLNGTGRGQGLSDDARRQLVDRGVLMLIYGKALQALEAGRVRVEQRNTDPAGGAPQAVDEAWSLVAGAPDAGGERPYALLALASAREQDFKLAGKLRTPLEFAFSVALKAAQQGDAAMYKEAQAELRGLLSALFYLSTLQLIKTAEGDTNEGQRQLHLAEGWAFFQPIRAAAAAASPPAAQTVEAAFVRPASQPLPASVTTQVYAALNEPTVLQSLTISSALVVRAPPGP